MFATASKSSEIRFLKTEDLCFFISRINLWDVSCSERNVFWETTETAKATKSNYVEKLFQWSHSAFQQQLFKNCSHFSAALLITTIRLFSSGWKSIHWQVSPIPHRQRRKGWKNGAGYNTTINHWAGIRREIETRFFSIFFSFQCRSIQSLLCFCRNIQ